MRRQIAKEEFAKGAPARRAEASKKRSAALAGGGNPAAKSVLVDGILFNCWKDAVAAKGLKYNYQLVRNFIVEDDEFVYTPGDRKTPIIKTSKTQRYSDGF